MGLIETQENAIMICPSVVFAHLIVFSLMFIFSSFTTNESELEVLMLWFSIEKSFTKLGYSNVVKNIYSL